MTNFISPIYCLYFLKINFGAGHRNYIISSIKTPFMFQKDKTVNFDSPQRSPQKPIDQTSVSY